MSRPPTRQWKPGDRAEIKTANYVLRPMSAADITDDLLSWFADREIMRYVDLHRDMDRSQFTRFLGVFDNKRNFCFGIFPADGAGCIGFFQVYVNFHAANARTAVLIGDKSHWGTGLVIETRAALLNFLFEVVGLHKVWGAIYTRNLPSVFNYKSQGFRCEGVLRQDSRDRDNAGAWHDVYRFAMLRDEWRALRRADKS